MKLSVIIPVYGVEKYIERCAKSLLEQSFDGVEYIFVDDCSKDNSITLLEKVLKRYEHCNTRIIHHQENKGLPAARNTGMSVARGDYIYHCDSDDYLEDNALSSLYYSAIEKNADIVWCDIIEDYDSCCKYIKQPNLSSPEDALKEMLSSGMRFNVWNKMCRRTLYEDNGIKFLEGNSMGEDMCIMKLFIHAKIVSYVPQALYHYVKCNPNALTKNQDTRIIEDQNNIKSLDQHLSLYCGDHYHSYILYHTLWTKMPLILTDGKNGQYKKWIEWDPSSHKAIQSLPNANKRIRFLFSMAAREKWWFVRLHYYLIIKLYYPIRYKIFR